MIDAAIHSLAPFAETVALSIWDAPGRFRSPLAMRRQHREAEAQAAFALPDVVPLSMAGFIRRLRAMGISSAGGARGIIRCPRPGVCLVRLGAHQTADLYAEVEEAARAARLAFFDPETAEVALPCRHGDTQLLLDALTQLARQSEGCLLYEAARRPHLYVQLVHGAADQPPCLEMPSNSFLPPESHLLPAELAALRALGWSPKPDGGHYRHPVDLACPTSRNAAAAAVLNTMTHAFRLCDGDEAYLSLDDPGVTPVCATHHDDQASSTEGT